MPGKVVVVECVDRCLGFSGERGLERKYGDKGVFESSRFYGGAFLRVHDYFFTYKAVKGFLRFPAVWKQFHYLPVPLLLLTNKAATLSSKMLYPPLSYNNNGNRNKGNNNSNQWHWLSFDRIFLAIFPHCQSFVHN